MSLYMPNIKSPYNNHCTLNKLGLPRCAVMVMYGICLYMNKLLFLAYILNPAIITLL